jgi:hypothetical protein
MVISSRKKEKVEQNKKRGKVTMLHRASLFEKVRFSSERQENWST